MKVGDTVKVKIDVLATSYTYPDAPVVATEWVDAVVTAIHGRGTVLVVMPSGEVWALTEGQYRVAPAPVPG